MGCRYYSSTFPKSHRYYREDTDKATEFLPPMWGLRSWQTFEYSPQRDEMIVGEPFGLKMAWAKLGSIAYFDTKPRGIIMELMDNYGL